LSFFTTSGAAKLYKVDVKALRSAVVKSEKEEDKKQKVSEGSEKKGRW
jgi:hypothetical protein